MLRWAMQIEEAATRLDTFKNTGHMGLAHEKMMSLESCSAAHTFILSPETFFPPSGVRRCRRTGRARSELST